MGSQIDDLVQVIRDQYKFALLGCVKSNCNIPQMRAPDCDFNSKATVLCQYLSVVLADQPGIFLWMRNEFYRSDRAL